MESVLVKFATTTLLVERRKIVIPVSLNALAYHVESFPAADGKEIH